MIQCAIVMRLMAHGDPGNRPLPQPKLTIPIKIFGNNDGSSLNIEQNYNGNNWIRLQVDNQGIKMLRYANEAWITV